MHHRRRSWWLLLAAPILLAATAVSTPAVAVGAADDEPCVPSNSTAKAGADADCLDRVKLAAGANMPYYHTYPLTGSAKVSQAVFVVHGTGRDAPRYFKAAVDAAKKAGVDGKTIVVTPWFQIDKDEPASGDVSWTNGDETSWKTGGESVRPKGISSFTVADEILAMLADKAKFPNLKRITVAGHSAGGQFVQRYAVGGRGPNAMKDVAVNFVPANPSSFMYFDEKRPASDNPGKSCPGYDDYKYGMKKLNPYLTKTGADQLVKQYTNRKVTYLQGEKDVNQDHSIDDSCNAKVQGEHRLARGQAYYKMIHEKYPSAPHDLSIVPGVGHEGGEMFQSKQGQAALFGK